jgi:hypothetical protein
MKTADQSELFRKRYSAHEAVLTTDTLVGAVNIAVLYRMLSSPGALQRKLCVGTYEKNAYQCNSRRRVAGGHGRWPEII